MIDLFRELTYILAPQSPGLLWDLQVSLPEHADEAHHTAYLAEKEVWEAERALADLYLDCDWDTKASEPVKFRRMEFIKWRAKQFEEAIPPLREEADKLWRSWC